MDDLVSTDWLAEQPRRAGPHRRGCQLAHAGDGRERPRGISRGPYPRRALPRHRCGRRHEQHPRRTCCRRAEDFGAAMEELGVGRDDRIIVYDNSADAERRARLVHAPPLRCRAGRDPRRRLPEMACRRPTDRKRPACLAARPVSMRSSGRRGRQPARNRQRARRSAGRCARPRPVRRHRGRPAPERRRRAHSGFAQLAVRRALQSTTAPSSRPTKSGICSSPPAPIPTSRSSPVAVRA